MKLSKEQTKKESSAIHLILYYQISMINVVKMLAPKSYKFAEL